MALLIFKRKHPILSDRSEQLGLNILASKGGKPYIKARLWRAPNESDLSWFGTRDGTHASFATTAAGTIGRRDRAALINDAGRVVGKITQYLFKKAADRTGIDPEWATDATGKRETVESFWVGVSELLTSSQWVWVQVDRMAPKVDELGKPRERTMLEKTEDRDVIRWSVWPSVSVPDWNFNASGVLEWIITEDDRLDNTNPLVDASVMKVRTVWRVTPAGLEVTEYYVKDGNEIQLSQNVIPTIKRVPFVLVGTPSRDPWWFDDVEMMQCQMMNLDSLYVENLTKTVYPQAVIPVTALEHMKTRLVEQRGNTSGYGSDISGVENAAIEVVKELTRGLDTPMVESAEESGITRFIMPNAADGKALPEEIDRKRRLMFDAQGLSLFNKETRQIQTAESKQFDQLDTESTLKHRARIMEEAETKAVELSKEIDPLFKEYKPSWPASFDVVDVTSDSNALTMIANLPDVTPSMRKMALLGAVRVLSEMSGQDAELLASARKEIDAMTFTEEPPPAEPPAKQEPPMV